MNTDNDNENYTKSDIDNENYNKSDIDNDFNMTI